MNAKVKVTANDKGQVIVPSQNNPEYGYIRVEQTRMEVDNNGFARKKTLSALISGEIEDLKGFGWSNGQLVDGQIVVKEQLEPFSTKNPERDYKYAGETGIVCCQDAQPIYSKIFFTFDMEASDKKEAHTNGDEIKAAYAEAKENDPLKTTVGEDTALDV